MNKTEALFIAAAAKRESIKAVDEKLPKLDTYIDARVKSVVSDIEMQTLATVSLQLRGADGQDGADGVDGRDGKDGERGPPGLDGVDGLDGADGADGADGKDGRDGVDGAPGRDGVDGAPGRDGVDGEDGIGISDVTINRNGDLIVTLTNGAEINAGRVKDRAQIISGGRGRTGLSAYDIAVKNGFTGTEEEWLDSLQGSGGATAEDTFETVSKNLRSESATIGYDGAGNLETLTYADGIVKTLAYNAGGDLVSITLSGATPNGISLVKTLTYASGNLTGVSYS